MMKWTICSLIFLFAGCGDTSAPLPVLSDKFSDIQKQTLDRSCATAGCHLDGTKGPFLWLNRDSAYNQLLFTHRIENDEARKKYRALVVPGQPDSSFLFEKIADPNLSINNPLGERMPQRKSPLPQNEIDAIKNWIKRGAPND